MQRRPCRAATRAACLFEVGGLAWRARLVPSALASRRRGVAAAQFSAVRAGRSTSPRCHAQAALGADACMCMFEFVLCMFFMDLALVCPSGWLGAKVCGRGLGPARVARSRFCAFPAPAGRNSGARRRGSGRIPHAPATPTSLEVGCVAFLCWHLRSARFTAYTPRCPKPHPRVSRGGVADRSELVCARHMRACLPGALAPGCPQALRA